jgi:hypothetical protein
VVEWNPGNWETEEAGEMAYRIEWRGGRELAYAYSFAVVAADARRLQS